MSVPDYDDLCACFGLKWGFSKPLKMVLNMGNQGGMVGGGIWSVATKIPYIYLVLFSVMMFVLILVLLCLIVCI